MSKLFNKSFLTRTISAFMLVVAILTTTILGEDLCFVTIYAVAMIGLAEMYKVVEINANKLGLFGYLATTIYYVLIRFSGDEYISVFIIGYLLLLMALYVFSFPAYKTEQILMAFFGVIYVSILMSFIYMVRIGESGIYTVWLIFICAWGCDTFAYLTGVTLGKHKLAPILSPKKSIEGAIGGVVGAAAVGGGYGYFVQSKVVGISDTVLVFAIIGGVGALISMIGDLAASAIKRNYDIKDYGKLIPGHGGVLDRFDSILFTAPIVYFFLKFLGTQYIN